MAEDLNKEVVDTKTEIIDEGGGKPPEPTELETKRENLLQVGRDMDKSTEEEKPEEEEEILDEEDYRKKSFEEILGKYPKIKNLNPKGLDEILTRYEGGLTTLEEEGEFLADLKKLGVDSPETRNELKAKLKAKEEIAPVKKAELPKGYKETRKEKLSAFLPKQMIDPETEMPRPITEEEKNSQLSYLENWAESIVPSDVVDSVGEMDGRIWDLKDQLLFNLFRLEPILEQFKDKILPDNTYADLLKFSKEYPRTCYEIMQKAEKDGQNPYKALYHHFVTTTQKDKIEVEKKKQWEEERSREEKKKSEARSETTRRSGEEQTTGKAFKDMTLEEKQKDLAKRMKQLA